MPQRIGVAKAAQMLGLSRHELQRMIHEGDLSTFEGQLNLDELRRHFPAMVLEEQASMIEHVRMIRATAFSRRVSETVAPEVDDLEHRLRRRNTDLSLARAKADKYRKLLDDVLAQLRRMCDEGDASQKQVAARLNQWLAERLKE